jgi:hypothetical protein
MPTAYARTDGSGRRLTATNSFRPLSREEIHGERLDPWDLVKNMGAERIAGYKFFMEEASGELVHRELDKYNLLLCHALRELNITTPKWVYVRCHQGAKQVSIDDNHFLIFGGRIYRK